MKVIQSIKLAACVGLALASFFAYAQTTEQGVTAPTDATQQQATASRAQHRAARLANRKLAREVRAALVRDPHISVANVVVVARDGAVTLEGSVPEAPQIDRATQVATGVAGVSSVKNALTLRQPESGGG